METQTLSSLRFEQKFPTGLGGTPPNLDVVLYETDGSLVAIESKFCEPFGVSALKNYLKPRYFEGAALWTRAALPGCQALAEKLRDGTVRFQLLDAAQLLKHMLGLAMNGASWQLLCLWYRPSGSAGDLHAAEIEEFAREIGQDAARFRGLSYQELFERVDRWANESHAAFTGYLRARYFTTRRPVAPEGVHRVGHTAEILRIENRLVKVADGKKTQTVNVCTGINSEGTYEQVYRIAGPKNFVSVSQLARAAKTLAELDAYLVDSGATKEGPRRRQRS